MTDGWKYFVSVKQDIAEGMQNVNYEKFEDSIRISWEDNPLLGTNMWYIHKVDNLEIGKVKDWCEKEDLRYIFTPPNLILDQFEKYGEFVFLHRKKQDVNSPFLADHSVRQFSFANRDIKVDITRFTKSLSGFLGKSLAEKRAIDQYIGSILHMRNGTIWTLEDLEGNIISSVLTGEIPNEELISIELSGTLNTFEDSSYSSDLFKSIISKLSKDYFSYGLRNSNQVMQMRELGFEEIGFVQIWEI